MKFKRKFDFEYRIPNCKCKKHLQIIPYLIDYNNEIEERLQIVVKTRRKTRWVFYVEY